MISAWSKMGQGQIDAALEALTPLSQTSGLSPMYDFHSGLINDLADRRAAAEGSYRNAVAGTGGLTLRTVEVIGAFYRRVGEPEQTKELVQRFIDTHPESTVHDFGGGSAPLVDGAKGGLAEAMFGMSGSLRQNNAPDVALIFGRMALDLQPNFPLAQVSVADLLQSQGNLDEANKIFRTIDPAAPVYWSTQLRLAANLEAVDDVDGAVKTLEALSVQHPNRPEAMITMADILRSHKRWEESVAAYDRALTMLDKLEHGNAPDRNHWTLYYSRGIALERSKQWTRAESDFLKALELSPDEPDVLNYLGYSWIEQGINLDKGKAMVEKAVAQRPTDGYIVDSLGWAYYRFQDFPKAVEVLERAIELHPEDPAINDHLGEALWSVGRKEEARFQWQRALIFKPDAELQAELEEKLKTRLAPPPPPIPTLPPAAPQKVAPEKLAPAKPTPEGK